MKIRKATKEDARKISILRRKTLRKINSKSYPKKIVDILIQKNSGKDIKEKMQKRKMFCAIENEKIIGTIDLEGNKIGGLYVHPDFTGRGIGKKLLEYIENYTRKEGIKKLMLYSTLNAENFYKKYGYKLKKDEIGWKDVCPVRVPVMEKVLG